jgi:hypothetical protein
MASRWTPPPKVHESYDTPEHNIQDLESEEVGLLPVDEAPELEEGSNSADDSIDIVCDSEDSNGSRMDDDELLQ